MLTDNGNAYGLKKAAAFVLASCMLLCTAACTAISGDSSAETSAAPTSAASTQSTTQESSDSVEYRTLKSDENNSFYTYEDMEADLETISLAFPELVHINTIAQTLDGRNVYDAVVGDANAENQIIINAGIHAREHITTRLVMNQLAYYLLGLDSSEYEGVSYRDLLSGVAIHVIPSVNPDGAALAQSGFGALKTDAAKNAVRAAVENDGSTVETEDFTQWKANAAGVDLNRNFDAKWDEYEGSGHPSSERYKGESVGCEPESAALIKLTMENPVKRTISYHTSGQVVYWYFGQSGDLYDATRRLASTVCNLTGYQLCEDHETLDPAGYKDWAISKLQIPGLTIEVGSGVTPVDVSEFDQIREQNRDVWAAVLKDLKDN